ncbi:MAG: hypothetical protein ACP5LF_05265 [Nitrososphaeria archaeon]|nr:hypothetical protein [Conexivisphaerales archaeon]
MPEIWLPYGEQEVSLKLKREEIEETFSTKPPESISENIEAKYYLTDGSEFSEKIVHEKMPELKPLDITGPKKEEVVDGYLFTYPEALKETVLVCSVRIDPVYWFKGPQSVVAQNFGADDEVLKRKDKPNSCEEDGGVWFSKRLLETSGAKAFCYFGMNGPSIVGEGLNVYEKIKKFFLNNSQKHKQKKFIIASAGGLPYDLTLKEALLSFYGISGILEDGAEVLLVAKCGRGLGDEGLRLSVLGISGKSYAIKVLSDFQKRAKLSMVTSLPLTYLKKLGIEGYSSLTEAYKNIRKENSKAFLIENAYLYCKI